MTIFEDAQDRMRAKRGDRLRAAKKKAELDARKYPYATYQGKDPIDGTDIVQVGSNEPVSGFKLISNAPMAIGDRVALRKNNQGGLQRVDDRNRLITSAVNLVGSVLIFTRYIAFGIISTGSGSGDGTSIFFQSDPAIPDSENNSFLNFIFKDQRSTPQIQKKVPFTSDFVYVGLTPLDFRGITGDPTLNLSGGGKILATFAPNAAIPNSGLIAGFQVIHTVKISVFPKIVQWAQTTPPSGVMSVYTFEESPLEIDIAINDLTLGEPDILNFGGVQFIASESSPFAFFVISLQLYPIDFAEQYTTAYRFRARGNPNWFTL